MKSKKSIPDSHKIKSQFGINKMKNALYIITNFNYNAGGWLKPEIIYPVYVRNTTDPTVLKLIDEATATLTNIMKNR